MLSPKAFSIPAKVHFVSPHGADVGSVFVDCLVPHDGGTSFYFGKVCVAILTESYLMIGPRQRKRSSLRREKPFRISAVRRAERISSNDSSGPVLSASA